MKTSKIVSVLLALAAIMLLAACAENKTAVSVPADAKPESGVSAEFPENTTAVSDPGDDAKPESGGAAYGAELTAPEEPQYVRAGGENVDKSVLVFYTRAELDEYIQSHDGEEWMIRCEQNAPDSTIGFLNACDKYGEEFFRESFLVVARLSETSGSNRHCVRGAAPGGDGTLKVFIDRLIPAAGTTDMAYWFIFAGFPKTLKPENGVSTEFAEKKEALFTGEFSWAETKAYYDGVEDAGIIRGGFANTGVYAIGSASEAFARALNEHKPRADEDCSVSYDKEADVWKVYFYHVGYQTDDGVSVAVCGGALAVYIGGDGITLLIVAGE
ncbi:MAG: hypothetical protein J6252_00435 [Clostridia bacterium]|nr:hypothetical protein [Clostridia bacterium]